MDITDEDTIDYGVVSHTEEDSNKKKLVDTRKILLPSCEPEVLEETDMCVMVTDQLNRMGFGGIKKWKKKKKILPQKVDLRKYVLVANQAKCLHEQIRARRKMRRATIVRQFTEDNIQPIYEWKYLPGTLVMSQDAVLTLPNEQGCDQISSS